MIVLFLLSLFLAAYAQDQVVYDTIHNITTLPGTWSSGSRNVLTGSGFASPNNLSFTYPPTTGMSYSFTSDGYYEIARYRMASNGTQPNCITGVMNWCHGTYQLLSNGSMVLTPFGDGYQQNQDPCAPVSNFIETYNDTEAYMQWNIYQDPVQGYALQMYEITGSPLPPMWLVTASPIMLPTQVLRNLSATTTTTSSAAGALSANAGERVGVPWMVVSLVVLGAASLF